MKILDKDQLEMAIRYCFNEEEANRLIEENTGLTYYRDKIAFLMGMFNAKIMFKNPKDYTEDDYKALLHSVVFYSTIK